MNILYTKNKEKFIAYYKLNATKKKAPFVIFHHGLMSDMNGTKALYIENYCKEHDYNFIRFDNFGHGEASGEFSDQNITSWLEGLNLVIDKLTEGSILLIGSSMGAWITMLKAIESPKRIIAMIGISAAPDFTEDLMWDKMTNLQQKQLMQDGLIEITGTAQACDHSYPISRQLILDGRNHLLLNKQQIKILCPVHLIHGMRDIDVSYDISERAASKIEANKVVLKLIKDGNHSLSRQEDLLTICNSIKEALAVV